MSHVALIAGVTGITGRGVAEELVSNGWTVFGLSRSSAFLPHGVTAVAADLLDLSSLSAALASLSITHVFFTTWSKRDTEAENCRVNGEMLSNLLEACKDKQLQHVALVTGTKHYLGPFSAYGKGKPITPFREDQARLQVENFYYTQEDILFERAAAQRFTWSVHRPHTVIGFALGNAMNMAVTLAVYASICKKTGRPFVFPGSVEQYNSITDVTDARVLGKHILWAASTKDAANQAFNVTNGEIFRWNWLWPKLAAYFQLEPQGPEHPSPLEQSMSDVQPIWEQIVAEHSLVNVPLLQLVSWWHTDADLGRTVECFNDMTKSRELGFNVYSSTVRTFYEAFDRMRAQKVIP